MAGYHCPMPTAFHPVQHKSDNNSISFRCDTTQNLSPFRGSVNECVLSSILSCLRHFFIRNANGIDAKNPDKTCRGKVMKEKLKTVKDDSSLFILYSSFCESLAFAPPNISFDRAKDHVSSHET